MSMSIQPFCVKCLQTPSEFAMMVHMNTNGKRLRELLAGAGLTQEQGLELFNNSRPKLFDPYALSSWKAFLSEANSTRWRPFSDKLLERAENIFGPMQKNH
jgi:hypothetical protein